MDYQTTLEHLYRLERFGIKLGLDNIRRLLSLLGDPQRGLKVLHVTGTNGKGSVCAYAASVLRAAGYRVGLYTSPHLVQFNERIRVDGEPITDDDVLRLWSGMQPAIQGMTSTRAIDHPTFFEVTTAMAFEYFREKKVDLAVIEVGMGGRMDATNVVDGLVSVITRVDLEHTEHLGKTVERIAREKAGIIKPTSRVVTVDQEALPVIEARCRELHVPLSVLGRKALLVTGILNDKGLPGMAAALGPMARRVYACRPKTHRAYDPEDVAAAFRPYAESSVVGPVRDAIDAALEAAGPDDLILITGSIYTAGEALDHLDVRP